MFIKLTTSEQGHCTYVNPEYIVKMSWQERPVDANFTLVCLANNTSIRVYATPEQIMELIK
jgi:hypothetical protein